MTKTLDLGCGDKPRNPFLADDLFGVDVRNNLAGTIRSADLVIEPIPFDDESFDYVTAFDFIEHIPRLVYAPHRRNAFVEVMNEIHRVLKPGGLFLSHTPAYPHAVAFRDPTHVNIITEETFTHYFDDTTRWGSIYGFTGAFRLIRQWWQGPHLLTVMRRVELGAQPNFGQRVSVLIPVHNGEKHLAQTLESLLAQTHDDFEAWCIDDASTDGSMAILEHFAERDQRIKIVDIIENLGSAPKALNQALSLVNGDWIVYSSQDDTFSPDWLERMVTRAAQTGADAVLPDVVLHHPSDPSQDKTLSGVRGDRGAVLSGAMAAQLSLDWTISGNALWRSDIVETLGFEDWAVNADEYSVRRFFLQCRQVAFCDGTFFYRQDNADAVTKRMSPVRFDWPYTHLRTAMLMREHGAADAIAERELQRAHQEMASLRERLERGELGFGEEAKHDAMSRVMRFDDRADQAHILAQPSEPTSTWERRTAKWASSLRKLPKKLGL